MESGGRSGQCQGANRSHFLDWSCMATARTYATFTPQSEQLASEVDAARVRDAVTLSISPTLGMQVTINSRYGLCITAGRNTGSTLSTDSIWNLIRYVNNIIRYIIRNDFNWPQDSRYTTAFRPKDRLPAFI